MNLHMVPIYKFCRKKRRKKEIKPPGESREQHLGEVRQGTSKWKFNIDPISSFINQILKLFNCGHRISK